MGEKREVEKESERERLMERGRKERGRK